MFWWVGPVARPAELGARLETQGLTRLGAMPGMAVDLHALNAGVSTPDGFTIETVDDPETLALWGQVTCRSFGVPETMDPGWHKLSLGAGLGLPLRYYLGRWNGTPVAASLMFLTLGVAGLFAVATAEHARRQGFGAAITLAPLLEAREMGYRIGVLSASPMGFSVYQRLGFQEYCKLGLYQWPPEPERADSETGNGRES
jgi:GNAT superfamily N-acetyltransferase